MLVLLAACTAGQGSPSATAGSASASPASAEASASAPETSIFDVEAGGINVHGSCVGERPAGAPAVVIAHGIGGDYIDHQAVRDHLVGRTVVCGYSRAGVGRSDPPPDTPRPVEDVVTEMHDVLAAAEVAPPYFLFGFSGGGDVVMMYAQEYPNDVVGFVSINPAPSHERWIEVARDIWTAEELQTIELDWYAGMNEEGIDMRGTSSLLTDELPPTMPYAIMFDEDCEGDTSVCDRLLEPLAASTELLANVGEGGRFERVEGAGHSIDLTEPQRVRDTLDAIWADATADPIY